MAIRSIIPGVFYFTGLIAGRVYLIEDQGELTLIDAGLGLAANRIIGDLKTAGHSPGDVKRILITHAHPDHIGGLHTLQAATGAAVYASALEKAVIEDGQPVQRPGTRANMPENAFPATPVREGGGWRRPNFRDI